MTRPSRPARLDHVEPSPPDDIAASLLDPRFQQCPYDLIARLHAGDARTRVEPGVGRVVHRFADATQAGECPTVYSSNVGEPGAYMGISDEPFSDEVQALVDQYVPMTNVLFRADPPLHTRQRALVTKALNARRVRELEPSIREICDELIDGFIDTGRVELNAQFAIPLPLTVIARMLGMDQEDLPRLKLWTDQALRGFIDSMDNDERAVAARAILDYQEYVLPRIAERREHPQDDLLSALIHAEIQDASEVEGELVGPRRLTDGEIMPIILQVLVGGNETTTCLIGNALVTLLRHPDAMSALRADHRLIDNFIEEALRYEPPVLMTTRRTLAPTRIGADQLAADEIVAVGWGLANQDPGVFEDPRTFDIRRANARKHLAFGHGPHFCPGSLLSRTETRIAFEQLLTRIATIRLADDTPLEQTPNFATRGYREIHLQFTPA
jgi:cytochrome P450